MNGQLSTSGADVLVQQVEHLADRYSDPTVRRLLHGGLRAAEDVGVSKVSIEQAAKYAGDKQGSRGKGSERASAASYYRHFETAENFRYTLHDFAWTEVARRVGDIRLVLDDGDWKGADALRDVFVGLALLADDEWWRPVLNFATTAARRPELADFRQFQGWPVFRRSLLALARRAQRDGSAPIDVPADTIADMVWAVFLGAWPGFVRRSIETGEPCGPALAEAVARTIAACLQSDDGGEPSLEGSPLRRSSDTIS